LVRQGQRHHERFTAERWAASFLSEWDLTSVASRSTISGLPASAPWSRAWSPASGHARLRTGARAVLIPVNAAVASAASCDGPRDRPIRGHLIDCRRPTLRGQRLGQLAPEARRRHGPPAQYACCETDSWTTKLRLSPCGANRPRRRPPGCGQVGSAPLSARANAAL